MSETNTADVNIVNGTSRPASQGRKAPRTPRVHTMVGGALFVGVALLGLRMGGVVAPLSGPAVLWSVVAFGALLIIGAILAAVIRVARR